MLSGQVPRDDGASCRAEDARSFLPIMPPIPTGALGVLLLALAACSPSAQGQSASSASTSAGSGGAGGHGGTTSSSTTGAGGSLTVGAGGNLTVGAGGSVTCLPSPTPPPGDCAIMGIQIEPPFTADYTCVDLGTLPAIPSPWGGFAMKADEPSTLLITGSARSLEGRLYAVPIGRDVDCHVSGFTGASADIAEAPFNEAGVAYGPGGVLFLAQAGFNQLGQLKSGSTITDKTIDLNALGVAPTICGVGFVPTGFGGAGKLKLVNWPSPGFWYDAPFVADGAGTYNVTSVKQTAQLPNGAAGFVFIAAGNPDFSTNTVLISEYDIGTVAAYQLTPTGDPDPATRKPFITGLSGAQGGVVDPMSGDFLFSTYSSARIIGIRGFKPPPPPPE